MTSRAEISEWFDQGIRDGATHLIIVCDTFDHEDYPVWATTEALALSQFDHFNGQNMQRVMEVYDLRQPKEPQMEEFRSMHLPKRAINAR